MKRAQTVAIVSDLHFPHIHLPTWKAFRKWHAATKPEVTVILGDFLDLNTISTYGVDASGPQDAAYGIKQFVKEANGLASETSRLVIIEGNHEARWFRKIIEPLVLQLAGASGFTLREQCGFHGLVHRAEWHTESVTWRGLDIGQFILRHGHKQSGKWSPANLAKGALMRTLGRSQIFGHHHRTELVAMGTSQGTRIAIANGHMEDDVDYSIENNWTRGFTILELDTEREWCTPYPVIIEKGRFSFGGTIYDGNDYRREKSGDAVHLHGRLGHRKAK